MRPNPLVPADLVTFSKKIRNGKLHFLGLANFTCLANSGKICFVEKFKMAYSKFQYCKLLFKTSLSV